MTSITKVTFSNTGGPEVMKIDKHILGLPGPNEVLVRHDVVGVNFIDTYYRSGLYSAQLPSGLGSEAAGIVEAVGSAVTRVSIGDRVAYASGPLGAYAEAHIVPENVLVKLPEGIDSKTAAAMMLKGLTVAYLLLKSFPLQASHTLLVHAAAGGVGSILTQWAHAIGATVIGSVGREEKVALAKQQGCDHVLLYREVDVPGEVRALTEGKGVDVVYDSVGKDTFHWSLDSLKTRGMMVSFGNASGAVPDFPPLLLAQKGSLFFTRPRLADYVDNPDELQELANALFERVISGDIGIKASHEYVLSDVVKAHKELESGQTTGSLVLIP